MAAMERPTDTVPTRFTRICLEISINQNDVADK